MLFALEYNLLFKKKSGGDEYVYVFLYVCQKVLKNNQEIGNNVAS